ncbi:BLUF domain-containing protein [Inquilinus sp. KBS0705]|nr:BLUF domain-containing protein [Inquilinus sp. KBS0705]
MDYYLIYMSKATNALNENQLNELLTVSRAWNNNHGITGKLVYVAGEFREDFDARFMQVLEGSEYEVKRIFENIAADPRHYDVTVLTEGPRSQRNFSDWSLKFETFDLEAHPELIEFFHLDKSVITSQEFEEGEFALNFLKSF